jgi:hypothetical protein
MYGHSERWQGASTVHGDHQVKSGLTDDELAVQPTVFAPDALKDFVVVVSGGAGGIGARSPFCLRGSARMSHWSAATRASSIPWSPTWLRAI